MMRMHVVQAASDPSDASAEDALWDPRAIRSFVGRGEGAPDATTLCRFRRLLEKHGLGRALLEEMNTSPAAVGLRLCTDTIAGATFVETPSSTKNARLGPSRRQPACASSAPSMPRRTPGFRKARCRNENQLFAAFALVDAILASRRERPQGSPACAMDPAGPRAALLSVLGAAPAAAQAPSDPTRAPRGPGGQKPSPTPSAQKGVLHATRRTP